jgi:hypothetical protein
MKLTEDGPASGELDIMEYLGDETNKLFTAPSIFGNPSMAIQWDLLRAPVM